MRTLHLFVLFMLLTLFVSRNSTAQLTQSVRGIVVDAESKRPIADAVVTLLSADSLRAITDTAGRFRFPAVPVGRQTFVYTAPGFEPAAAADVMVISGKETELNVVMKESLNSLGEITVRSSRAGKPLNEFAAVSARSFSPEETRRYAASFADPARMVMNFPGVSNNGDMDNSIVVRGNSPRGVLWRLEGIEIPTPNHFSDLGNSGGPISMLNAATLGTSDFYTGAFAPEIGNALSGAFDLSFRNGSTTRAEHAFQIGVMGLEAATEGPFRKGGSSSYLVNYRYSTVALLERFTGLDGILPLYQDAAFKLHFPTKKWGTFSVFGLGGYNSASRKSDADSAKWNSENENIGYLEKSYLGVAGISHQYFVGKDAYLKTILSVSHDGTANVADTLNPGDGYRAQEIERQNYSNTALRASLAYNQKLSARHTVRAGIIAQHWKYGYGFRYFDGSEGVWKSVLGDTGSTQYYQAYVQWKARVGSALTLIGGAHASYYALSGKGSIEPRASATYAIDAKQKVTLATGLHSKPEHPSTHLYQTMSAQAAHVFPNKALDLLRAFHAVAGYERSLPLGLRTRVEGYYQHLYNIGVERASANAFSLLNADGIYSLLATENELLSTGTGENYGVDISLERPFSQGWYAVATGSLFRSTYTDAAGNEYDTRFNRGYTANVIFGKEFKVRGGKSTLGLNGKLMTSGGLRESPINVPASRAAGETVYVPGQYFSYQGPGYFRADASVYYRINRRSSTHTLQLDVQNITNRENYYTSYYDADAGQVKRENQLGLLPNVSYRIEFHR